MNIDYIHEFCALAEVKKYSEAAEISFISQSALSKHIKSLEAELGAPLFHRTAHCVVLTEFGEAFLPYAKEIGEIQMKCQSHLISKIKGENPDLSIGISYMVSADHLFSNFSKADLKKLGFSVKIRYAQNKHLRQLLTTGQCDLIIATEKLPEDEDNFIVFDYYEDPLCFVTPKQISLTRQNILNYPYIQISNESHYGMLVRHIRKPDFVVPSLMDAYNLIEKVDGFTVSTAAMTAKGLPAFLQTQEPFIATTVTYYLMYNSPEIMSSDSNRLLNFLQTIHPALKHNE